MAAWRCSRSSNIFAIISGFRPARCPMSSITHADKTVNPRRYFEAAGGAREEIAEQGPVCLYLEVTNRCNLLCETCPRTFDELEPPADLSWDLFTKIVDQMPNLPRA